MISNGAQDFFCHKKSHNCFHICQNILWESHFIRVVIFIVTVIQSQKITVTFWGLPQLISFLFYSYRYHFPISSHEKRYKKGAIYSTVSSPLIKELKNEMTVEIYTDC